MTKASAILEEAAIVDSIPADILEENHNEQPKKERKARSDTGVKRERKPVDKYSKLEKKLVKVLGIPAVLMTLAAMKTNNEVMLADSMLIGEHVESFAKRLVDVAKEHDWLYKYLETFCNMLANGSAVGALIGEVIVIALGICRNHGITINIPGISFFS